MSSFESKVRLFSKLSELGFTYQESNSLRRIQLTLHRWAEMECNGEVQRDETTGKPFRKLPGYLGGVGANRGWVESRPYPIADKEAGALKRLAAIVKARNERHTLHTEGDTLHLIVPYYQGDPRGCVLYLVKQCDIGAANTIDAVYYRGLAVCA